MTDFDRFFDPEDAIGLRAWREPGMNRLFRRLAKIAPRPTIPERRAVYILMELFGDRVLDLPTKVFARGFERLMVLDWITGFRFLAFFTEKEVREHALLYEPPCLSKLGHFWHGLLQGESPSAIDDFVFGPRRVYSLAEAKADGLRRRW
jgi:hypothetical protein